MSPKSRETSGPLTPIVVHILMALSEGPLHGYAIMKAVRQQSGGAVKTGPGSVYGSLERMEESGLVQEARGSDQRRRVFEITRAGKVALQDEVARISSLADLMRDKGLA